MSAGTDPPHEAFPEDDHLYRIFWAGRLLLPSYSHSTPRVHFWLKEVDEDGNDVPRNRIVQVIESVGSIPRLPIGSFWRNRRKSRPKHSAPTPLTSLEIVAPAKWNIVRAGDAIPIDQRSDDSYQTWISRWDLQLKFHTSAGQMVDGHHAHVVSAKTVTGQEIIIPCYEIFRSLFAGTTDLSLDLLSRVWSGAEKNFIVGGEQHEEDDGTHWHIDLVPGVPPSAVPYLSWLHFDKTARSAADQIYPSSVNEAPAAWITATPPVIGTTFRIRAHVVSLKSRNALLVTQINNIDFPLSIAALSYSIARRDISVDCSDVSGEENHATASPNTRPISVSKPRDRSPTRKYAQLPSTSTRFVGLPDSKCTARSERFVPLPKPKSSAGPPTPRQVSVGVPGKRPAPGAAQFTPTEQQNIEDRFQAIMDLVEELIEAGKIGDVIEYPLVRPTPEDAPRYCAFQFSDLVRPWPWPMVREPRPRPRLALVLQLAVEDRLVYWIETETTRSSDCFRSLAVEMVSGASLDAGILESLLDLCEGNMGRWPEPLPFGKGVILAAWAQHSKSNGKLSRNVMLLAFKRLARERATLFSNGA